MAVDNVVGGCFVVTIVLIVGFNSVAFFFVYFICVDWCYFSVTLMVVLVFAFVVVVLFMLLVDCFVLVLLDYYCWCGFVLCDVVVGGCLVCGSGMLCCLSVLLVDG